MIIVNDFSLSPDFKTLYIDYTVEAGDSTDSLKLYIGDRYLSSEFIDLTSLAIGEHVHIELQIDDPLIAPTYSKDVYDGIFTITVNSALGDYVESVLLNAFYTSICFANLTIEHKDLSDWNELNALYLYLQSAITYASVPQIEQALSAYSKVESICGSKPEEYFNTDISECGQGLGCWIVNGVYIIKR